MILHSSIERIFQMARLHGWYDGLGWGQGQPDVAFSQTHSTLHLDRAAYGDPNRFNCTDAMIPPCRWCVTGAIHFFIEGAFAVMPEFHKDRTGNIFADICECHSALAAAF